LATSAAGVVLATESPHGAACLFARTGRSWRKASLIFKTPNSQQQNLLDLAVRQDSSTISGLR
jgi:hypothetical protein